MRKKTIPKLYRFDQRFVDYCKFYLIEALKFPQETKLKSFTKIFEVSNYTDSHQFSANT